MENQYFDKKVLESPGITQVMEIYLQSDLAYPAMLGPAPIRISDMAGYESNVVGHHMVFLSKFIGGGFIALRGGFIGWMIVNDQ